MLSVGNLTARNENHVPDQSGLRGIDGPCREHDRGSAAGASGVGACSRTVASKASESVGRRGVPFVWFDLVDRRAMTGGRGGCCACRGAALGERLGHWRTSGRSKQVNGSGASNLNSRQVIEGAVSAFLAALVGSNAVTVAKVSLAFVAPDWLDDERRIIEASLFVILVATALSVVIAAHATRQRWVQGETLVVVAFIGVIAAFFAVLDHSVLVGSGQPLYFFGWVMGLWFLPALFLPNPNGARGGRLGQAFDLLVVAAPMTVIGLVTGLIVEQGVFAQCNWILLDHELCRGGVEGFWIAKPVGVNAVGCALAVVACPSIWWPGLRWTVARRRVWTPVVTLAAAVYAGVWGPYLYESNTASWVAFMGFGLLPVVGVVAVRVSCAATRQGVGESVVGWAVSRHFRWVLPTAFVFAFGVSAAVGLAPIENYDGMGRAVFVLAHGVNGGVMGMSLLATVKVFRLMPYSVE